MELLVRIAETFIGTIGDIAPLLMMILVFQLLVLRQPLPRPGRTLLGVTLAIAGMALFIVGLEKAIFPIGRLMAAQLSSPDLLGTAGADGAVRWQAYGLTYLFAALIGFSTTIAEPALIAVAQEAEKISRGAIRPWGLRIAVALGVAIGVSLGTLRLVTGFSLALTLLIGYVVVVVQTYFAPRMIIPLAYDSGGVTTSTVTVPLVAALGLGLASSIPGRNPLVDGFGLIAFASLFPMMTVLGYGQLAQWLHQRELDRQKSDPLNNG